jgi:hypothetical protein
MQPLFAILALVFIPQHPLFSLVVGAICAACWFLEREP